MAISERAREVGVVFLVAHIVAVVGVSLVGNAFLQAAAAITTVVAILAFLTALVTRPVPTGWERFQVLGGILVALLVNHY
jgi:energy-converting hydrogenase Eha subunit E